MKNSYGVTVVKGEDPYIDQRELITGIKSRKY